LWCKKDGPGKVAILIDKDSQNTYDERTGKFTQETSVILWLKELKVLFVTQYNDKQEAIYGVYSEDGRDLSGEFDSGFHPEDCRTCHTGYSTFCINGQCGTSK
jgi:hypothetical protein